MLPSKFTKVFSEISGFSTTSEKAIMETAGLYKAIGLGKVGLVSKKHHLQQYLPKEIFLALLVVPFVFCKKRQGLP